jgi:hypothetical protein
LEIEQSNRSIKLQLDHYVSEMLVEYKGYIMKSLGPMREDDCSIYGSGVVLHSIVGWE